MTAYKIINRVGRSLGTFEIILLDDIVFGWMRYVRSVMVNDEFHRYAAPVEVQ